jgi:hypothetical protein
MSTILVIEPHRMLQQAFATALPFTHKVRLMETLPEISAIQDFDVVIIDAAALMDKAGLAARELRALQGWKVPTIWIENDGGVEAPSGDRLVTLAMPVQKDALLKALAACLTATSGEESQAATARTKAMAKPVAKAAKKAKEPISAVPAASKPAIIELVEVVEEAPAAKETSTQDNS